MVGEEEGREGGVLNTFSFPAPTQIVMPIRMTAATALFTATDL